MAEGSVLVMTRGNARRARRFEHLPQHVQHVPVPNPLRHLLEQQVMLHRIEEGAQVQVHDARLVPGNRRGDPVDRRMGFALRTVPIRPWLEVGLEDRFQDELDRSLDHPVPNRGRFSFIQNWVEIKLRRHWLRNRKRRGFGWTRWRWLRVSRMVGVFLAYRVRPYRPAVASAR